MLFINITKEIKISITKFYINKFLLKKIKYTFKKNLLRNQHWDNFYPKHQSMEELDNVQVSAEVLSLEA